MTATKVIDRLVEFAPPIVAAYSRVRARCIAATALGCDVLHAFDIEAEPYPVLVELANRAYLAAKARGADPVTAVARGGHVLVINHEPVPNGWPGHLMIHLPAQSVLLDLDFQQFNRPEQEINGAAAEMFPWPAGTTARKFANPDGAQLAIQATNDRTWEASPDWTNVSRRAEAAAALMRAIRKNRL